jgi:hypothetical protein
MLRNKRIVFKLLDMLELIGQNILNEQTCSNYSLS